MSSMRTQPNSRAVFFAENNREKITRFNNRRHPGSRINPLEAYPTPYQVAVLFWLA